MKFKSMFLFVFYAFLFQSPMACIRSGFYNYANGAALISEADAGLSEAGQIDAEQNMADAADYPDHAISDSSATNEASQADTIHFDAGHVDSAQSDVMGTDSQSFDAAFFDDDMYVYVASISGSAQHLTTLHFVSNTSSLSLVGSPLPISVGSIYSNSSFIPFDFYFAGGGLSSWTVDTFTHLPSLVGSDGAYIQTAHMRMAISEMYQSLYLTGDGPGSANLLQYSLNTMTGLAEPMSPDSVASQGGPSGIDIDPSEEIVVTASYLGNSVAAHRINNDGSLSDVGASQATCTAPREVYFSLDGQEIVVVCDGPPPMLYLHHVDVSNASISASGVSYNAPGGDILAVLHAQYSDTTYLAMSDNSVVMRHLNQSSSVSANWTDLLPSPATSLAISTGENYIFVGLDNPPRLQVYALGESISSPPSLVDTYSGLSEKPVSIVVLPNDQAQSGSP